LELAFCLLYPSRDEGGKSKQHQGKGEHNPEAIASHLNPPRPNPAITTARRYRRSSTKHHLQKKNTQVSFFLHALYSALAAFSRVRVWRNLCFSPVISTGVWNKQAGNNKLDSHPSDWNKTSSRKGR
jgi:hypothetical protein